MILQLWLNNLQFKVNLLNDTKTEHGGAPTRHAGCVSWILEWVTCWIRQCTKRGALAVWTLWAFIWLSCLGSDVFKFNPAVCQNKAHWPGEHGVPIFSLPSPQCQLPRCPSPPLPRCWPWTALPCYRTSTALPGRYALLRHVRDLTSWLGIPMTWGCQSMSYALTFPGLGQALVGQCV